MAAGSSPWGSRVHLFSENAKLPPSSPSNIHLGLVAAAVEAQNKLRETGEKLGRMVTISPTEFNRAGAKTIDECLLAIQTAVSQKSSTPQAPQRESAKDVSHDSSDEESRSESITPRSF